MFKDLNKPNSQQLSSSDQALDQWHSVVRLFTDFSVCFVLLQASATDFALLKKFELDLCCDVCLSFLCLPMQVKCKVVAARDKKACLARIPETRM